MTRQTDTWGIAVAKARLSEVIERAQVDGPQLISRNGRSVAVVVSFDEWERKTKRQGTLAEFFAVSPLPQSGIDLERIQDGPREIDL